MIIGIDLGTSTSEVAYIKKNGEVVVIPNKDNELITPSVVHLKKRGKALIGSAAKEFLFTRPESTFMEVKRSFGTDKKYTAHGKEYTPEEIQAHIIEYLVDCAEEYTGEEVTSAVITVPAYFTDIQRKQTIRAGALAGVKVERVINEPTAAALDYGLKNLKECENILVYDFGGGTLDVTVLELFEGVIDVKSSCGNNQLGGKDFDALLMKHIAGKHYNEIMTDPTAEMKLKQAATDAKVTLSDLDSANIMIPLIKADLSVTKAITRDDFEALIKPLVESTSEQIETALKDAGLTREDLQRVILVGGTTRIPFIQKFVEDLTGLTVETPENTNKPELMVVSGAAVQAGIVAGIIDDESSIVLTDVCPFSLGTKVVTVNGFAIDPIIPKNVTIPYEFSKKYTAMQEYQRAILFEVYQGESVYPQSNTRIGELMLDKLPQRKNEKASAEVTFSYDVNGILHVKARALGNNNTVDTIIDINNNDLPVRPPVNLDNWEKADGASKYRPLIRKVLKIIDDFLGEQELIDLKLHLPLDNCNELKRELILGNNENAEIIAGNLRDFIKIWDEKMHDYNVNYKEVSKLMKKFQKLGIDIDDLLSDDE